jgi:predicted nucleic acid-binding protein
MRLALDTSVLLAIFNGEDGSRDWLEALVRARRDHELVVCDVVSAELTPAFATRLDLDSALAKLGARFDPIGPSAAWLAGSTFRRYREEGGPRQHLIPDFLVAAHAKTQATLLAAVDRGYLRRYFPEVDLLQPHE